MPKNNFSFLINKDLDYAIHYLSNKMYEYVIYDENQTFITEDFNLGRVNLFVKNNIIIDVSVG